MKFIVNNYSDVFGGQERYILNLTRYLSDKGFYVIFRGQPEELSFKSSLSYSDIKSDSCDVRILNGNRAIYLFTLKKKRGEFWVYVHHSNINDRQGTYLKSIIRKFLLFISLKRADLVVRVCNNALPEFYAPGKVITIYNGVDLPEYRPKVSLSNNVNLLMVGAVNKNKNQQLAIELLVKQPNAYLTIVGDGSDINSLKRYAEQLGVSERIHWTGFVTELDKYYRDADFLLMLSHFEAFPYSVLEAMSNGTPVIAVPVGGVPEIIKSGVNGWLVEDYAVNTLAEKINQVCSEPQQYIKVASNARRTIETSFTKQTMFNMLLTEIKKRKI
ncbi:glycosyltransferase family 4 protein [Shewanella xiamenensis]|uniref:glycosyltransferase family 4 protein n=1 Tax=Shewanella xiamenensis TaxID=332186 RepID=UPI001558E281|nr:glycosyltransferase family 4 protein [Shewanella xiamenensis]